MTSLCRHLSAQEIVNWVTTADGCVHTDDTTKLSPTSCEFVFTPPTPTRQNSFVLSASRVCIGHYTTQQVLLGRPAVGFIDLHRCMTQTPSLYSTRPNSLKLSLLIKLLSSLTAQQTTTYSSYIFTDLYSI